MTTPQENQPGEAAQDLVGSEAVAVGASSETATLIASITEYLSLGGLFNPEMMDHNAVRDLLINCRTQLAAERAKRLELEKDMDALLAANLRVHKAREAELLALRGGEVGQTDLGGTEAKADGEPKPTSAREWWIARWPDDEDCYAFEDENSANKYSTGRFLPTRRAEIIHVREVTGEGRKVSADCLEWLESMIMSTSVAPCVHAWCRELLCVLSEEGGRQKEGGTEITSASKSSETLT